MNLGTAQYIAQEVVKELTPFCDRIEIAGSIRRQKAEVGDIEIVCIPTTEADDLFSGDPDAPRRRVDGFRQQVNAMDHIKGSALLGKFMQRTRYISTGESITVDIFTATPDNWGYIFAIRTGSMTFSKGLANTWVQAGFRGREGMLHDANEVPIILREERDLFELLQRRWVEPEERNW